MNVSPSVPADRVSLLHRLLAVREHSLSLTADLSAEDQCLQSMPDASPTKWHLAHTTWFFETLVLGALAPGYRPFDAQFPLLFNSYYESLGPRHPRPQRGLLSRPSAERVRAYRTAVDDALARFILEADADTWAAAVPLLELGLNHEQQHQELLLTDIQHGFSLNPLRPAVRTGAPPLAEVAVAGWAEQPGGLVDIGHAAGGFSFDNETPRHRVWLAPHALARRLVTNREYAAFIVDGGYRRPSLWLSEGWTAVQAQDWRAPMYWELAEEGPVSAFGLHGQQVWRPDEAVRHLSFFEAAAYAEWAGARLPTEFEWEAAAAASSVAEGGAGLQQLFGTAWQWTRSSYDPYPHFRPWAGAVGEYNGKFMIGQVVLRGSSSATPAGHARITYRNFFPPATRWQFSGLRLAMDL